MNKCTVAMLVSGLLAPPMTSHANAMLGPSETVFTFNFTGATPGPPYSAIRFSAVFDASDPVVLGDVLVTNVYGGPDGTELIQSRNDTPFIINAGGTSYGPLTTANPIFNPMLDGVFSFGLSMTSGTASLVSFTSCGLGSDFNSGPCQTISPDTPVPPLPEPGTLALLGFGLAGLGLSRRRKAA